MRQFFRFAIVFMVCVPILSAQTTTTAEPAPLTSLKPPVATIKPVTDTYFGTAISDPHRWMEKGPDEPEFVDFLKKQNDFTRSVLGQFSSQRDKLLKRIEELDNAVAQVRDWQRAGEYTFYLETAPGARNASLMVREKSGLARKLLDPESYSENGSHAAID